MRTHRLLAALSTVSVLLACSPSSGEQTATGIASRPVVLSEWNLEATPAAEIGGAVASWQVPVRIESAWLKCAGDSLHILLLGPGLSQYLASNAGPRIFLTLYLDTDGSDATGSRSLASEALVGFEWSLDFSTMQTRDKSGEVSSVLNCQVSKWEGDQFSGDLSWGTRFNKSMKAANQKDYAEFLVPGSVLSLCPAKGALRLGFAVPDATYVSSAPRVVDYRLSDH